MNMTPAYCTREKSDSGTPETHRDMARGVEVLAKTMWPDKEATSDEMAGENPHNLMEGTL